MLELFNRFELVNGEYTETGLAGVRFFRATQHVPRTPLVYEPGICIVAQGRKIGFLGGKKFHFDADNYLVTTVTMPFECETFASPEAPLLGLYIDVDMAVLHTLIGQIDMCAPVGAGDEKDLRCGIGPAVLDADMKDAVFRLIQCLSSEVDARILGPGLVREILYRVLYGDQANVLYSLSTQNGNFAQVSRVLRIIQSDYAKKIEIDQLAQIANMSASAFHKAFKEITSDSPLQYIKKIRLNKARYFMTHQRMKAYMAADRVGYESPSQFSREFKRYFGQSPAEMIREMRPA